KITTIFGGPARGPMMTLCDPSRRPQESFREDQGRTVQRRDRGAGHALPRRRGRFRRPAPTRRLARRAGHRLPAPRGHHRRVPGRPGSNMLPETMARMAEAPNIVAVKEATGSMDQASQIAALCGLTILSGDDSLTLPLMSVGGRGVVSVVGNVVPRDMKALIG